MGAEGSEHPPTSGTLGVPVPGAAGIGAATHQPIKFHQPGRADGSVLQKRCELLKFRDAAVLEIHGHAHTGLEGLALQALHLSSLQGHRFFQ